MRIDSIYLQNFRNFSDAAFSFPSRFTVLIGENGKGKSSLMQALRVAMCTFLDELDGVFSEEIEPHDVRRAGGLDHFAAQFPVVLRTKGKIGGVEMEWTLTKARLDGSTKNRQAKSVINYAKDLQKKDIAKQNVVFPVLAFFSTARLLVNEPEAIKRKQNKGRIYDGYNECLDHWRDNYPALRWIKTRHAQLNQHKSRFDKRVVQEQMQAVLEAIAHCVPGWSDLEWHEEMDDLAGIYTKGGRTSLIPHFYLSDGLRIIAGMAAEIAYRCVTLNGHLGAEAIRKSEGIILIDELDMHLHPTWQRQVVGDLKDAFPGLQFIVSTHSPFIIQSLHSEELLNLDQEDSNVSPKDLSLEDVAESIMGVSSIFGVANTLDASHVQAFLQKLGQGDKSPNGLDADKPELTAIANRISDPGVRALVHMKLLVEEQKHQ